MTLTNIDFTIDFHGPFRVGGGEPVDLFDAPVRREDPLPQSSIKGLMRAEASERLRIDDYWVTRVFGSPALPCPWWWSPVKLLDATFSPTTKVRVDDVGRSMRGFLRFGEQAWATGGSFSIEQVQPIPESDLSRHKTILMAAAASVTTLGESRLRGSGWVSVRPTCQQEDLARQALALMTGESR